MTKTMRVTNANGRVIARKMNGVRSCHEHDAFGNTIALISSGAVTGIYTYWPYEETRTSTERPVVYDPENRLTVAVTASQTQTYTYDGDGLRRGKVVGVIRTTFVWDGSDYLMEY